MGARRDRTGELVEDDVEQLPVPHDPLCRDGWLPATTDDRARPCLTCKPHLRGRRDRLRRRLEGDIR
jgi:hypothetical protein